jgi:Cys-rich repeat protein
VPNGAAGTAAAGAAGSPATGAAGTAAAGATGGSAGGTSVAGASGSGGTSGSGGQAGAPSSGGGAPCARDADCGLASLHCDQPSGLCFECVADADCRALGLSRCDAALHRCVECGVDQDCQTGFVCELTIRRCAQACAADNACPAAAHSCDETRRICVECEADDGNGCTLDPKRPFCLAASSRCVECLGDQDCTTGLRCDNLTGKCLGCRDSRDCPAAQACEPAGYVCVAP